MTTYALKTLKVNLSLFVNCFLFKLDENFFSVVLYMTISLNYKSDGWDQYIDKLFPKKHHAEGNVILVGSE